MEKLSKFWATFKLLCDFLRPKMRANNFSEKNTLYLVAIRLNYLLELRVLSIQSRNYIKSGKISLILIYSKLSLVLAKR